MPAVKADQIRKLFPRARADLVQALVNNWDDGIRAGINTPLRTAHFFAQIYPETGGLQHIEENLNYSAVGLRRTFKKYFPDAATAQRYARQPKRIANRVYANRMGNGDERSGDGWKYRGGGIGQVTGRTNYAAIGYDDNPDELRNDPDAAIMSAFAYWRDHSCAKIADRDDAEALRRVWNGGKNGLPEVLEALPRAKRIFGGAKSGAAFYGLVSAPVEPKPAYHEEDDGEPDETPDTSALGDPDAPDDQTADDDAGDPPPDEDKADIVAGSSSLDDLRGKLAAARSTLKKSDLLKGDNPSSIMKTAVRGYRGALGTAGAIGAAPVLAAANDTGPKGFWSNLEATLDLVPSTVYVLLILCLLVGGAFLFWHISEKRLLQSKSGETL